MRKKRTSVVHRICTLVGSLFCFILIPLLLINCTLIIKSITNKNEVPDIGGIFPMVILTDSMNPQLASGDLVICRKVNAKNIKTGDVICFYDPEGNGTAAMRSLAQMRHGRLQKREIFWKQSFMTEKSMMQL